MILSGAGPQASIVSLGTWMRRRLLISWDSCSSRSPASRGADGSLSTLLRPLGDVSRLGVGMTPFEQDWSGRSVGSRSCPLLMGMGRSEGHRLCLLLGRKTAGSSASIMSISQSDNRDVGGILQRRFRQFLEHALDIFGAARGFSSSDQTMASSIRAIDGFFLLRFHFPESRHPGPHHHAMGSGQFLLWQTRP